MPVLKIKEIELFKVKSFGDKKKVCFDSNYHLFSVSGRNGAGKSTFLKGAALAQKGYFCKSIDDKVENDRFQYEALRFLNEDGAYVKLVLSEDVDIEVVLRREDNECHVDCSNEEVLSKYWNIFSPENLILFVDASKGFSEETLKFDEINISNNSKSHLALEAVLRPESLFSGVYKQFVRDHIHERVIPNKPNRLLYFNVASKMFSKLIPTVELKNFSGKHTPGEFVLLGRANKNKRVPLYDVREFSSGEKALLSTLAFLCISKSVCTLIIDEPENHFHESLLLEFVSVLSSLCEHGGINEWVKKEGGGPGRSLKQEWVEQVYREHDLNQVIVSTHSKSLIYKTFTLGKNYILTDDIYPLDYGDAEDELRRIGLSSVYNKVLLVEGDGDHEALEHLVKNKNVSIKSLKGSKEVIEAFKKIVDIKEYVKDVEFVFLVDCDNKPQNFFEKIRGIDEEYYDKSFIVLDRHEFENYMLDPLVIKLVVDKYLSLSGREGEGFTEEEVEDKIIYFAKESLPAVYKKELSLSFQQFIDRHFSNLLWGDKSFEWSDFGQVGRQINEKVVSEKSMDDLQRGLKGCANDVFSVYENASNQVLIRRCDGKQVVGRSFSFFSKACGAHSKHFKDAVYKTAFDTRESSVYYLAKDILSRFS